MKYLAHFQYFKESGKHYSDGQILYEAESGKLSEVVHRCRSLLSNGLCPGLTSGKHEFHAVVTIYDDPNKTTVDEAAYSFMVPFQKSGPPAPPPATYRPGEQWRK